MIQNHEMKLPAFGRGFHLITHLILKEVGPLPQSGLMMVFIRHTSAALTINENADPTVLADFETVFNKLIPENATHYQHISEGSDDMPAHIKSTLIGASVSAPIIGGKLGLGMWQGIYLCEFRNRTLRRKLVVSVLT